MKRRTPILALFLSGVIALFGLSPAQAVAPDAPGVTLDPITLGHVTGTVTSGQPFVFAP